MKRVYQAANSVEAHMIAHLLEQAGLEAHVQGEHLQSGAGELPVGLVAVAVADEDVEAARAVIREWEAKSTPSAREASSPPRYAPMVAFLVGAVISGGVVWSLYNGPEEAHERDRNDDGRIDERTTYEGERIMVETDRNFDGAMDAVTTFDRHGDAVRYESDDDFDGMRETVTTFRRGEPEHYTLDWDEDGAIDYRADFESGVLRSESYLDRATGRPVKRVNHVGAKADRVEFDLDGDGQWERSYRLDRYDEPVMEGVEGDE
jgi:Putative prokaryotic signal transducing protein